MLQHIGSKAACLPHQRTRGKLMWVWWVTGSTRLQGTIIETSVFIFIGDLQYRQQKVWRGAD
eukprot:530665-Pelagomonas_calceolata.AAC.1